MQLANIFYVLFALLILWGIKPVKLGQWNDEVMSFDHTKAFLGFSSIGIILHHCAEKTCAPWMPPLMIRPGLEGFVWVGYLFVASFFFCSGYGMYKSSKKEGAFKRFFLRRMVPVLLPTIVTWIIFVVLRYIRKMPFEGDPIQWHPHIWYVPVLILLYIAFFVSFGLIKNEKAGFAVMTLVTVALAALFLHKELGTWWCNTLHLFLIGMIVAKYEKPILSFFKKGYVIFLILTLAVTVVGFAVGNYWYNVCEKFGFVYDYEKSWALCYFAQVISAFTFAWFILLLGMKLKIGNPVLKFLGKMTLDTYMFQAVFVFLFAYAFIDDKVKAFFYIKNVTLYTTVVLATSLVAAYLFHLATKPLVAKVKGVSRK